jgi:phosphatidylglycerophosphatase A
MMGTGDNQNIVIDEVIGLGITAWTAGRDLKTLFAAFVLFRFFDVIKPPPVRQVDLWSKRQASPWAGGFGVIADDIVAGFQALAVILVLQYYQVL